MKRCPNCSEEISDESMREGQCNHCGQEFYPSDFEEREEDSFWRKRRKSA